MAYCYRCSGKLGIADILVISPTHIVETSKCLQCGAIYQTEKFKAVSANNNFTK